MRRPGAIVRELNTEPVTTDNLSEETGTNYNITSRPKPLCFISSDRTVRNSILQKGPDLRNIGEMRVKSNLRTVFRPN